MGRHSAPDDESDQLSDGPVDGGAVAVVAPADRRGRHSRPDEDDLLTSPVEDTIRLQRIDASVDVPAALTVADRPPAEATVAHPPTAEVGESAHSTAADFALVRAHGDVRNRVIAAVLVPFALYTAALAALGKLGTTYLLWIWIPLITAGVLVGLFLDLGHRKYSR